MAGSPVTEFVPYREWDDEYGWCAGYEVRKKFPSGMTGVIQFQEIEATYKYTTFNVYLDLRRKRKRQSADREVTGRDGLEPASWALTTLTEFEEIVPDIYPKFPTRIEIGAADQRRWNVYERILTKRGYNVTMIDGNKTLVKKIGARHG